MQRWIIIHFWLLCRWQQATRRPSLNQSSCWPRTDVGSCFHFSPLLPVFWCSSAVEQSVRKVSVVDCEGWVNVAISWKWCLKCVLHRFPPEVYLLLYLLGIRLQPYNKRSSTIDNGIKCLCCFNIFVQAPAFYFYLFASYDRQCW